ncbi:MAG: YitT family protein [Spirochaetaceae bacterium]|jgi:uncharacterized membrane-anchored protein YitT (DUF2179 family)|nr:YitT family protein [Spirochaetaceae bacterium]
MVQSAGRTIKRLSLVLLGSVLMAFNINTFVRTGGLIPGGFTGVTLLFQETALRFFGIQVPFSIILYILNAIPAIICFRSIGKKFTLYSCLVILISGLLTDIMPSISLLTQVLQVHDALLSAVFGGILNAVSISLCLYADATTGGTDFIAIFISEKYRKDAWNYIFAGNCVILMAAAFLFTLDRALYSIIFQFTTTVALSSLYRSYQQRTLLIITGKPDEIYTFIKEQTNHGATAFRGIGYYEKTERTMLYSVVSANEISLLVNGIKKIDSSAFINILKTEQINGRFYKPPKD